MTVSEVQFKNADNASTVTLSAATTAGNSLIVAVSAYNTTGTAMSSSAPTLNGSSVAGATLLAQQQSPLSGYAAYGALWLLPDVGAGTVIAVALANAAGASECAAWEFSGLGASPVVGPAASANGASATPSSGTTAAVSSVPAVVIGFAAANNNVLTTAPGAPWTSVSLDTGYDVAGYQVVTSGGGAYAWAPAASTSADWVSMVAVVSVTGAAAPAEPPAAAGRAVVGRRPRRGGASGSPAPAVHLEDVPAVPSGRAVAGRRGRRGTSSGSGLPLPAAPPAIKYRDGNANYSPTSPFTLGIPGDVQAGDIVLVYASLFSSGSEVALTGSANTPAQLFFGANGVNDSFMVWAFTATGADAGAALTFTESGVSTFIGGIILAYSGAGMPSPADVSGGFDNADTNSWPAPSLHSRSPACWGVYLITAGVGDGDGAASYAGGTLRQQFTVAGVSAYDSNAPVGPAGTTVGGGTWTTASDGPTVGITVALPPAGFSRQPAQAAGSTVRGMAGRRGRASGSRPIPVAAAPEQTPTPPAGKAVRGHPGRRGTAQGSPQPPVHVEELPPSGGMAVRGRPARRGGCSGSPPPRPLAIAGVPVPARGAAVCGKTARKGSSRGSPAPTARPPEVFPSTGMSVRGHVARAGRATGSRPIPVFTPPEPPASHGASVTGRAGRRGRAAGSVPVLVLYVPPEPPAAAGRRVAGRRARRGAALGSPLPLVRAEQAANDVSFAVLAARQPWSAGPARQLWAARASRNT